MSTSDWPSSPLDAAQRAFTLLVQPPSHVGFDGRGFEGLPDEILPLDDLRDLLLSPRTGVEVRDAVWRELVVRARRDGPAWVVAAVGVAMPGLRRIAGLLAAGWRGDTDDLDSELIVGFVARLKTIDLDVPRICGRLIDAGLRAARKARDADCDAQLIHIEATGPIAPIQPWDHPDLVLARAVAAAVIDADEANLISATRLDTATVAQVADTLGIAASTASAWRAKAERRLAAAISAGELAFIPLRPRRRRANTATSTATNTSTNGANGAAVGPLLGAHSDGGVLLATQQQAFGGKTSDRKAAGVGAPGIGARPA
jgi:transposase-like protein